MRRLITFACAGETLVGTLDAGGGTHALLIVSGGNEVRAGAHRGMALLAARLAADGVPVFRYDRRGVGDSTGENLGFEEAAPDLAAACATLRGAQPQVRRVVALGNCDAAALLALHGGAAGVDQVVLTNPWTGAEGDALPPAAAIRAGYAAKLRDWRTWARALTGGVDLRKFAAGLRKIMRPRAGPPPLATTVIAGIERWGDRATVILADCDATALAYAAAAKRLPVAPLRIPTASHSFARPEDGAALEQAIRAVLQSA